jgi:hypothetical protein
VVEESRQHGLLRHGLIPTAVLFLLVAGVIRSEVLRAVLASACLALMFYQWRMYHRTESGARLVFLSLVVAGITLTSAWLALNVVRFYTYDGGSGRVYGFVVRVQDTLVWMTGALLTVVTVWIIVAFARWLVASVASS